MISRSSRSCAISTNVRNRCISHVLLGMVDVNSFAELLAKLEVARNEYQRAFAAQREALFSYTDEPNSNAAQEVHHGNETLKLAMEQYTDALDNLSDHVLQHTRT
jgi:hypothetical protein